MEVLRKDIIRTWLLPHLSTGTRGGACRVDLLEVVEAILFKLKTGCQWRQLPVKQFFTELALTWSGVYDHVNEWRKDGSWKRLWVKLLQLHRRRLDWSSVQLDGSHTLAKNGGAAIGYQGRKAARTTNLLFLADSRGQPLACASPQAGNHQDLFDIETSFGEVCSLLQEAQISLEGLFLNADSGFDSKNLREDCFRRGIEANIALNPCSRKQEDAEETYLDTELYRERTAIERTNSWLDSFKTLLVRFETNAENWLAFHFLAFAVLLLRKIPPEEKY
ncbi:MAG: IS5 family transposase [Janthinobacterium lividum]